MKRLQSVEKQKTSEKSVNRSKIAKVIGRVGLAFLLSVPAADLALSDVGTAKVLQIVDHDVHATGNKGVDHALQDGIIGAQIMAESVGLGLLISRNKKIRNSFNDYGADLEARQKNMSNAHEYVSKALNVPFKGLEYLGNGVERAGNKISTSSNSKATRAAGNLLIDTGSVNAAGTSAVIMSETMDGRPTKLGRNIRLGGLITASWLGGAEVVRSLYNNIPYVKDALTPVGEAFSFLTSPDFSNPVSARNFIIGGIAVGLATKGWQIAKYHEEHHPAGTEQTAPRDLLSEIDNQIELAKTVPLS